MSLSYTEVAEILKIIDASECEEVILETGETRLVVRRGRAGATTESQAINNSTASVSSINDSGGSGVSEPPPGTPSTVKDPGGKQSGTTVRAPMVGTFYRRPAPDEAPFVEVGTKVSIGDSLCMIEVMKLYTTIQASISGTIEAILAEDAELVEFDQPMFIIRPDGS